MDALNNNDVLLEVEVIVVSCLCVTVCVFHEAWWYTSKETWSDCSISLKSPNNIYFLFCIFAKHFPADMVEICM